MKIHHNAKTTPAARAALVHRALQEGWSNAATAAAFAVSERTVAKWIQRYRAGGLAARAADATLQDGRPRTAVRVCARPGAESLPSGPTSATGRPPPVVEKAGVSGLECGDLRLLIERRRSVSRQRSALASSS